MLSWLWGPGTPQGGTPPRGTPQNSSAGDENTPRASELQVPKISAPDTPPSPSPEPPSPPRPAPQSGSLRPVPQRSRVALAPGCSPLDWARMRNTDLRGGVTTFLRVTPSELERHNTPSDAWTAIDGRVYNITPYMRFHPGGKRELMRVAGRDGTALYYKTHAWVNIDAVLGRAMVGALVHE